MIPFQKIIAWFLIGLLAFEVIFRVPFSISDVAALESEDHEDVVSLLVEEDLFRKMSSDIDAYARRIQARLPHTRTVILTFPRDAHPYVIASANERLYFSGLPDHGNKTQKLVGTILIGHLPIPVVHKDNTSFLSLFPYTDFDEPHFFWNWDTSQYEFLSEKKENPRPDIWHSVISPNTGNIDTDVTKIRSFFARVYEYDDKKGRYQNVGTDPQILYMDSINESRAASKGLLSVYEQFFIPNQEHTVYNRFSREFAQYLYSGFLSLMKSDGNIQIPSFQNWKPDSNSGASFLNQASDITTKVFSDGLITPFIKVINEKYMEDVAKWVHNTGRYYNGSSDVRVDTIPEMITAKDSLSAQIIKESNDVLEKMIDTYVEGNLSLDIPILVSRPFQKTITETEGNRRVNRTYNFIYDNYFYGTKANTIKTASDCSLIRGSTFGGVNTTVQMNHGYNMLAGESDGQIIARDTDAGIVCQNPTLSYWGGNSPLNSTYRGGDMVLNSSRSDDFIFPILDHAAGKKTTGTNSPLDCLKTDLILRPYQHQGLANRKYNWPAETNGNRYSCATPLQRSTPNPFNIDPTPERDENILSSLVGCSGNNGDITLLDRDGKNLGTCQTNGLSGTYKRISSLIKHSDPTTSVFGKQLQGLSTPNLPIDEERYLLYLNREGTQSRVNYPNLFDIVVNHLDTDEVIIEKIYAALSPVQSQLTQRVNLPNGHKWSQLVPDSGMTSINIADALLANNDIRIGLLEALRWKYLDTQKKYISVFERALAPTSPDKNFILPEKKDLYEISYLGGQGDARNFVFGFNPEQKNPLPDWFTNIEAIHNNIEVNSSQISSEDQSPYMLSSREISTLLGESDSSSEPHDEQKGLSESELSPKLDCEILSGIVVWEWLTQILCWLQGFTDIKSYTLTADTSDFPAFPFSDGGMSGISGLLQPLKSFIKSDSNKNNVQDYVENNGGKISLNTSLSARTLSPRNTLRVNATLNEGPFRLDDDSTNIRLEIIRIDDLDEKKSYSSRDTDWSDVQKRYLSVSGSTTLVDGHASWSFSSQNNNRARITFASRIYDNKGILLSSEQDSVLIGPVALNVTVIGSTGNTTPHTITAGDTRGLELILAGLDTYPETVDVSIQDYVTGQEQSFYKSVPVANKSIRLGSPAIDSVLRKSGKYAITVIAGDYSGQAYFMVSPDKAVKLEANLSNLLIRDTPEKVSFSLQDVWGNSLDLNGWNIDIKTSTKVKIFPFSSEPNRVFSGKASPIIITPTESGNTTFDVTITRDNQKISTNFSRPILSDALLKVDIPQSSEIQVGEEIPVNFTIQRADGTLVDNWDTSISVGIRGGDAKLVQETLTFQGGRATTTLKTGTKPGILSFYMKDTGFGKTVGENFQILPGEPVRMNVSSPETLFARPGARGKLTTRIYDNFGNLTTLHGHSIIATTDSDSLVQTITGFTEVSVGIYETDIVSLGNPGRILFRAWLQKDGKKSPLPALENVSQTNVLPVITSEEAGQNRWQNLTQVLLGAPFGQTPIEGYFGGSTLFASETKTLALTTLLDNSVNPVVTVMPTGAIRKGTIKYGSGIKVQIESYINNSLTLGISDSRLGTLARIHYPAMSNISFAQCEEVCLGDMMTFTPSGSDIYYKDRSVYRNSEKLFSLSEIFSLPNISLSFIENGNQYLQFSVTSNAVNIGTLSLSWKPQVPKQIGTDTPSGVIVEPIFPTLLTKLAWSHTSSHEIPGVVVYTASESNTHLGGAHTQGWSAYPDKNGLGWTDENTALLQFASGQEWSKSMEDHADYLSINLGDPIIHLPQYAVDTSTGFDKTLGEPVYISGDPLSDFTFRDANNDENKDLIVYHDNGTVGMGLIRQDSTLLDAGDLLSITQARTGMIRSGDFTGDGYSDIVFVDKLGNLHQVIHTEIGQTNKLMEYNVQPIVGEVQQLEVFDMDNDGIDDIIVMDHLGSLFIFYGDSSGIFRVQLLDNVYDFVLSDKAKSAYFTGAIRYDGPGFVDPNVMTQSPEFDLRTKQGQVNNLIFTTVRIPSTSLTTTVPSSPSLGTVVTETIAGNSVNSLSGLPNGLLRMYDGSAPVLANSLRSGYDSFEAENDGIVSVVSRTESADDIVYLLKAPFITPLGLSVVKQYSSRDVSQEILPGSQIEVNIMIKNNSQKNIGNILLLEKFADYFSLPEMQYELTRGDSKETRKFILHNTEKHSAIADLRNVSIVPGETITLTYTGTLKTFSFGKFDVGYLEDSQDPTSTKILPKDLIRTINTTASEKESIPESEFYNHDSYGDIRFNPNETCGGPLMLWRSHNEYGRTYHKTLFTRDVPDPTKNAVKFGQDPSRFLENNNTQAQKSTGQNVTPFPSGLSWDYRIGSVPSVGDRDVYMVDLFAASSQQISEYKKAGKKVVCYVNAGALQSGAHGQGLSNADTVSGGAQFQKDWDEKFLNIRSSRVRDVMKKRLDLAVQKGCQGIEPDNIDAYDNDTSLTQNDTIDYMKFLSQEAHSRGLAIGLKNASNIASRIEPFTDFAIVEQCHEYDECSSYNAFSRSGKAIFAVEYDNSCPKGPNGFSNITCSLDLDGQCKNCGTSSSGTSRSSSISGRSFSSGSGSGGSLSSSSGSGSRSSSESARADLETWNEDSDGDSIPDKDDNDYGDVFEMIMKNNIPQILTSLGNIDSVVAGITGGIEEVISTLGSGFSDCISQPINWSPNMPGNTLTAFGYPIPKANIPPRACHKDVRCGIPAFAYPTGPEANSTWPPEPYGAGGALDYLGGGSNVQGGTGLSDVPNDAGYVTGKEPGSYVPGLGISQFRLFLDMTLTGALTELVCFGPNNAISNKPGMFPLRFDGNCIYAVQQLFQCLDDGSKDSPLDDETDVSDTLPPSEENETNEENPPERAVFSNTSSCLSGNSIDVYPSVLSQSTANYFNQSNNENASALLQNISENASVLNSTSSDSPLGLVSKYGDDVFNLILDPKALDFMDLLLDPNSINLESVRTFPNFIMDWYQRQMDEIIASLTQFPDLNLLLPDLSTLADPGAIPGLDSNLALDNLLSSTVSSSLLSSTISGANISSDNFTPPLPAESYLPKIFNGAPQQFFDSISQKTTVHPKMKRIYAEIPYVNGPDLQKRIIEYQSALSAPQTGENQSRLQQNIETLKEYQKLPEKLQEAYYEKEKHLYSLSQNVSSTQEFMGDWMKNNGGKFNDWVESFVLNTKMLDSWQMLIDLFNDYEVECGVNRNERWNLQHWLSIVISAIIPKIPIIEMPRFPDFTGDYSKIDISIDAEIPDYNLTFYPVSLPDAPIGLAAGTMPLIPEIPDFSANIAPSSVDIPQLPDLPPVPQMPSLAPALKPIVEIFEITTKFQCLYRKVPLVPEWFGGTKVAHKTERQGYLPFDFIDKDLGFLEAYKEFQRFSTDINTVEAIINRSLGDTDLSFDFLEEPLQNLQDIFQFDTGTQESVTQIPEMINEFVSAVNNPEYVDPDESLAQLGELLQTINIPANRREQLVEIFDTNGFQKDFVIPAITQMNARFDLINHAINMDRAENNKIIQDLVAWGNNTKTLEQIPSLAHRIARTTHFAESNRENSYLASLDLSILNPSETLFSTGISSFHKASPLFSITTENPAVSSVQTTLESTMADQKLSKTRGLYITQGSKSQKLIYYTDDVNRASKLHTVDDDSDGDLDLYYSLGNIIYRKENYTKTPTLYTVKDAPKVYTNRDIYRQFFNIRDTDMSQIPRDGQIFIKQNNSAGTVSYQVHMKEGDDHMRLSLFRSLFETRQNKGRYQVDIIPQAKNDPLMPISSVPTIADIDGTVFIEHNKIYRTLLTKGKYIDENGSIQELSPEFVIRSGQSGYTSESTVVEVTTKGKTASYTMTTGQRLRFTSDSSISVIKGSLILFSNTVEKRPLNIRDIGLPLLSNDRLITDTNGSASLIFPDGQETIIGPAQYWSLAEYAPGIGIKKISLPVEPGWYYATITDARSPIEKRFPLATIFDAYSQFSEGSILSNIPPQIRLSLPSPTEIDFQSYFPADTLEDVEIFRLPSSQYRKLSATKFAFETQKESTQIVVRVNLAGKKRDYTTRILTETPKLGINSVDKSGKVSGKTLSVSPILPLGIQSYIDNQSWTLARGFGSNSDIFSTSVVRNTPKISLNFGADPLTTFDRNSGVPTLGNTFSLAPLIHIGQAPGYSVRQGSTERLLVRYDFPEMNFRQIATLEEINKSGIYVLGSGLRLEPATLRDALKGGAYITDTAYRPVVTLDNRGILRTLDTNVSWSVKIENNYVIFTLSRDRVELGKIIFTGDVITTLENTGV